MLNNVSITNPQLSSPEEVRQFREALRFMEKMVTIADEFAKKDQTESDMNPVQDAVMLCDTKLEKINGRFTGTATVDSSNPKHHVNSLSAEQAFGKKMPVDICCYGEYRGKNQMEINGDGTTITCHAKERIPDFYTSETTLTYNNETGTITFDDSFKREQYWYGDGTYSD